MRFTTDHKVSTFYLISSLQDNVQFSLYQNFCFTYMLSMLRDNEVLQITSCCNVFDLNDTMVLRHCLAKSTTFSTAISSSDIIQRNSFVVTICFTFRDNGNNIFLLQLVFSGIDRFFSEGKKVALEANPPNVISNVWKHRPNHKNWSPSYFIAFLTSQAISKNEQIKLNGLRLRIMDHSDNLHQSYIFLGSSVFSLHEKMKHIFLIKRLADSFCYIEIRNVC